MSVKLYQDLVDGLLDFTSRQNLFYSRRHREGNRRRDHLSPRFMLRDSANDHLEPFISFPICGVFEYIVDSIYQHS